MKESGNIDGKGRIGTAIVLHPVLPEVLSSVTGNRSVEDVLDEAIGLTRAIDLDVLDARAVKVTRPSPATLLGKGAVETIGQLIEELKPSLIIINHSLSPVQQRNLEEEWQTKVIDRTGLILEIFGARAQTKEGQIQVDLAALEYEQSRLVRTWTHLERQRGGTGGIGGPGEKQIELDRRMLRDKIAKLKRELETVLKTRELQRKGRAKVPYPIIALVGYTNAGKSTLFNRLTGSSVFAKDLLFATLDPTMRQVKLPTGQQVILSDTVGFISNLPTGLIAAFRATLEQVEYADVILHIRDISRHDTDAQREDVMSIMADLGIEYETDGRVIEVLNKIDALPEDMQADLRRKARFDERKVAVSAATGEGMNELLEAISGILSQNRLNCVYDLPHGDGEAIAWLHARAHVMEQHVHDDRITLTVRIDPADQGRFKDRFGYDHQN